MNGDLKFLRKVHTEMLFLSSNSEDASTKENELGQ